MDILKEFILEFNLNEPVLLIKPILKLVTVLTIGYFTHFFM